MKKIIMISLILLGVLEVKSQVIDRSQVIHYIYDRNGNRVKRELIPYEFLGMIKYDNAQQSPMESVSVSLSSSNSTVNTDKDGVFRFNDIAAGNYNLSIAINEPWGAEFTIDPWLAVMYYIGLYQITDQFVQRAGDVTEHPLFCIYTK